MAEVFLLLIYIVNTLFLIATQYSTECIHHNLFDFPLLWRGVFCFPLFLFSLGYRLYPTMNIFVNNDFLCLLWIKVHNEFSIFGLKDMYILPNYFLSSPSWDQKMVIYCIFVNTECCHHQPPQECICWVS